MSEGYDRLLRWYPPVWRERYGDEMAALLEDTYTAAAAVPFRQRLGLACRGLAERARYGSLRNRDADHEERARAGSLLVLCGWALSLVGLAVFAKSTDNWFARTPATGRWLADDAVAAAAGAGVVGCVCVLVAALVLAPAFVRLLRAGRWHEVRSVVGAAALVALAAVSLVAGGVIWAHHLSLHDRNGGSPFYGAYFVVASLSVVAAIAWGTAAAVAVARRVEIPRRTLRALGRLALGLTLLVLVALAGLVIWWASEAVHAPGVLSGGIGNGVAYTSATVPPALLAAGALLAGGAGLALWGSTRVHRSLHAARRAGHPSRPG